MKNNWVQYLRYAILLSTVGIVQVFFVPQSYASLGSIAWALLVIIMLLRPLADIFPDVKAFRKLLPARKELGIASAMFGIAHGLGFFLAFNMPISGLWNSGYYWRLDNAYGWGMWAIVVSIPLLLTSNLWAMKLMKKHWKRLQRLSYLFFVSVAVHVALIKPHEAAGMVTIVGIWLVLWTMAHYKINFRDHKKTVIGIIALVIAAKTGTIAYEASGRPDATRIKDEKRSERSEREQTKTVSSSVDTVTRAS